MGTNELAIRFTEEKYLTKSEVAKELRMTLIDNIWSNILTYRSNFYHYLTLKSIDKATYVFCQCPSVTNLINSVSNKEASLINLTNFVKGSSEERLFEKHCLEEIALMIARKNKISLSADQLKNILNETSGNSIISNYVKTLKKLHDSTQVRELDIDYLSELYSQLFNLNEITDFYRITDDGNHENRVIIDRVYTSAPAQLIDGLMTNLFSFLKICTLDKNVKALTALFFYQYVKPFSNNNDELAMLFTKSILAKELGPIAYYLPLETLICDNQYDLTKVINDVQRSSDVTFYILYAIKQVNKAVDSINDYIVNLKASSLKEDFYKIDEEPKPIEEPTPVVVEEEKVETKPQDVEVIVPKEEVKITPAEPKVETKIVEKVIYKEIPVYQGPETSAFDLKIQKMDEKEIAFIAERLLELDPELSKKEARFYANHSSLGRLYSIDQFKKEIGCVYETARTSMDHLAALGYYKKQQIKNKFLYTPISRR